MTGVSKLSSKNMKPHARVAELIKIYGKPISRILLKDCGVGHMNRAISWKYVHSRLRMILENEGFSNFRYKYAVAVEPQDSQPLASTTRTQHEVAESGGMLGTG